MPTADDQHVDDVTRIAASVREVLGARATMVSRVVDDDWLEVVAVVGEPSEGIVQGLRWRRSDLDSMLAGAEQLGRLHATVRRVVSYAEIPDSIPETERYIASHLGLLLAPLHSPSEQLLGVLSTEGPVDIAHPAPGTCELVELYAEQARLALGARRDHETLEQLLRLEESRRDLVASITHDLKTPLTAIALNAELLESDGRLAEAGSHPVAAIRRSADRLSNLVDDLLALARAEDGGATQVRADLVQMVREACGHLETQASLRGVTFEVEAPEELWVAVDAHALARVFANLVSNAVKFSLPRGKVVLRLSRRDDLVEFQCADEGIGIHADRLSTIFAISRRTPDAGSEEMPGSGIGLAICARIVARLGGEITVESSPGQGSTFTLRLPG